MERAGGGAGGGLLAYLPQLWAHADSHSMLRAAVLANLLHLLKVHRKKKIAWESNSGPSAR
ncbi:hypothetical protein JYU34_016105 [Plutella xylostella]|uniref:Uncharacterized protein n=1 Tax=Plutella xylostella TaxID=51655 RepID=A0ABQ7Q5N6_PLUXY|nr:hypothetical protein JYU34_016105 [Plutella xylostella]